MPGPYPSAESSASTRPAPVPLATYRLQFNRFFTFREATERVPYLHALGISDLYASPYLQARSGSLHGYDISDHNSLNPEIGTPDEYAALTDALREHGMGHLLDIVPNHMGIGEASNRWWMDVLENGPSSPFARFFDIDWYPLKPELSGKVLLPILGDQFGRTLEAGEIRLRYRDGHFWLEYYDHLLPVAPRSGAAVLREAVALLDTRLPADDPARMELESIVTALERLPPRDHTDPASVAERRREKTVTERRLRELRTHAPQVSEAIAEAVNRFNGTPGQPRSFDRLEALANDQAYRLAFWRVAAEEINYRRFFDINDLAGVRVELPEVFRETHRLILRLVGEGRVTGLRIDHPDGLFDPRTYLRRLQDEAQERSGTNPFYIVVEKILTGDERLPDDWPVAGTVGYEQLNLLNEVLVAGENESAISEIYERFVRRAPDFETLVYEKKKLVLRSALVSELNVLANLLGRLSEQNRRSRDFTLGALTDALREIIACFPVYRTYTDAYSGRVAGRDREYIEGAIREAKRRNRGTVNASVFDFVHEILLLSWPKGLETEEEQEHARFVMKFQQLTGPVMAKGVEDTSFYLFNRLVSLNEVGGEPDRFGISPREFHRENEERAARWPHALTSTSTHDTKRSEDVRARINVLSEIPDAWEEHVRRWAEWNAEHRSREDEQAIPDANDEFLLYQTLLGAWPPGEMNDEEHATFVGRIQAYMEKATREAKTHTSWINPNEAYDRGTADFIERVLHRDPSNPFPDDLRRFHPRIARGGMLNALSQTLLKITGPGVPDIYQGQEVWDFSLVDPDNRRPVDFDLRARMLRELRNRLAGGDREELARELVREWEDGRIKMYVTHLALEARRAHPEVFGAGVYRPLEVSGERGAHALAFAREGNGASLIAVVPRLPTTLLGSSESPVPTPDAWRDTRIVGPGERYRDHFTGRTLQSERVDGEISLPLGRVLDPFPVALLERIG